MARSDLFTNTKWAKPPRKKPRIMAHVIDAGERDGVGPVIRFKCPHCNWDSDWLIYDFSLTEAKRGIPCENCNKD